MRYTSFQERSAACRAVLSALAPMHLEGRVIGLSGLMTILTGWADMSPSAIASP